MIFAQTEDDSKTEADESAAGLSLAKSKPNNGLSETKKVQEERNRLEVTFGELRKLVEKGSALREEMDQSKKMIANCQTKIEANRKVKITRQTNLSGGILANNCNTCRVVCSIHRLPFDVGKQALSFCSMCPEKCDWNLHSINVSYLLESSVQNVPPDPEDVKKLKTYNENLEKLIDEERRNAMDLEVLRCQVNVKIEELDKMSLCPFVMTPEYANLMV